MSQRSCFILLTFSHCARSRTTPLHVSCHVNWHSFSIRWAQAYSRRCTSLQIQVEMIARMYRVYFVGLVPRPSGWKRNLCVHLYELEECLVDFTLYVCVCCLLTMTVHFPGVSKFPCEQHTCLTNWALSFTVNHSLHSLGHTHKLLTTCNWH